MAFLGLFISFIFSTSHALEARDLKSGDVLLQSLPCYVCALVEMEEAAPYSHIGVVLKKQGATFVLQAWGKVQALDFATSLGFRKAHTATLVLRPIQADGSYFRMSPLKMSAVFESDFKNLNYDPEFLWDNRDSWGETLYCSEFVAKFMNRFLPVPIATKPMHYMHYREDWIRYFGGTPPDGKPGVSPGDFLRSPLFKRVGEIPAN